VSDPHKRRSVNDGAALLPQFGQFIAGLEDRLLASPRGSATSTPMTEPSANPVEDLARELWEAHATHHEELTRLPAQAWEQLDAWMQNHWRMLARVALNFAGSKR
jgi:hypothetical protein